MRIWFDTEFIENGKTIELISIGAVRADGLTFYAEDAETDLGKACPWVQEHVLPHLNSAQYAMKRADIAERFRLFCEQPEHINKVLPQFWAYYGAYDWVALCQLYGRMVDLPQGWPMFCRDLKQLAGTRQLIAQTTTKHHALSDALWTRLAHMQLTRIV